jgi:peroxiredoxin
MRRTFLYAILALVAAVIAIASYRLATQTLVVRRPVIGGPPVVPQFTPPPRIVGKAMPHFNARALDGSAIDTNSLRGRVVIVDVWATWCRPCREEMPHIEQDIWQKHRDRVAVLAVAMGESAAKVTKFNEDAKLTFALIPDPDKRIGALYGGNAPIPRTYVIDGAGRVVHQSMGYGSTIFGELVTAVENAINRSS